MRSLTVKLVVALDSLNSNSGQVPSACYNFAAFAYKTSSWHKQGRVFAKKHVASVK